MARGAPSAELVAVPRPRLRTPVALDRRATRRWHPPEEARVDVQEPGREDACERIVDYPITHHGDRTLEVARVPEQGRHRVDRGPGQYRPSRLLDPEVVKGQPHTVWREDKRDDCGFAAGVDDPGVDPAGVADWLGPSLPGGEPAAASDGRLRRGIFGGRVEECEPAPAHGAGASQSARISRVIWRMS